MELIINIIKTNYFLICFKSRIGEWIRQESILYCFLATCMYYFGEGNGTPLQYSCLENPMGGGAW